jgi:hypothetical protein
MFVHFRRLNAPFDTTDSARLYRASLYGYSHFSRIHQQNRLGFQRLLGLRLTVSEERPLIARCSSSACLWVAHVGARQLLDVAVLQPRTVGILVWFGVHVPKRRPQSRDWRFVYGRAVQQSAANRFGRCFTAREQCRFKIYCMLSAANSLILLYVLSWKQT